MTELILAPLKRRFVPHNYLLGTATRNVQHQVRVDYNTEGVQKVTEPGENPSGTLKFQDTVPKLWSYQGDIAVSLLRKCRRPQKTNGVTREISLPTSSRG